MKLFLSFFLLCSMSVFGAVPDYRSFRGAGGIIVVTNPPTGTIVIDGSGVVSSGTNSAIGTYTNGTAVSMAATNNNFTAGNNTVLKGTNIGSTAHINYGMASNLTFNSGSATLVLGTWGDIFGVSNATAGGLALFMAEPDLGNDIGFGAGILVGGTVLASNVSLTSLLGSGNIMAITGGGVPYRTNLSTVDTNIGVGQTLYLDKSFGVDATASRTNLVRPFQTPSNFVAAIQSGDTAVVRGGAYPINPKADPVNEPSFVNYSAGVAISNKSNIRIVGEPGAVWYMSSWRSNGYGFSMPMMWFQNCTNVVIDGMTFIGMRTNATNFGYGGLVLNGCDEVTVKNCTFSNWQNHAIVAQSASTVNSRLRFWNNTFADCGGTNHVTLQMDGTAINVEASNFEAIGNRFYRNLRNIEFCCDSDVRKVLIELNTSEGCYFDDIVLHATNSSEVIIANNISKGYAGVLLPGASSDSASWLNIHAASNVTVRGNIVGGYHNGITAAPASGYRIVDIKMEGNTFHDITAIPIAIPAAVNMVGNSAFVERLTVKGNTFLNSASVAVLLNASDSVISDNEFYDCNLNAFAQGVICLGFPTAGVSTNSTNMSIVANKLVSSAANAAPGIVIYGMCYSNVVYDNIIDRKFATAINDLGVGTRSRPVNLVAPGSLLRSDALGDERAVTIGANLTFDGTTLAGTGGGSSVAAPISSVQFNSNGVQQGSASFVFTNGNVGIGTATPAQKIHIAGSGATYFEIQDVSSTGLGFFGANGTTVDIQSGNNAIRIIPNGTETARFAVGGSVGIGTPTPLATLDVSNVVGTATRPIFHAGTNTTSGLTVTTNGNVGIGTATPATALHVAGQASVSGSIASYVINSRNGAGTVFQWYNPLGTDTRLFNGSSDVITFQTGGNVGIGTTTPLAKLDVSNAVGSATGPIFHAGTNIINGLTVDTNGNVGIGTNTPESLLSINGVAQASMLRVLQVPGSPLSSGTIDLRSSGNSLGLSRSLGSFLFYYDTSTGDVVTDGILGGSTIVRLRHAGLDKLTLSADSVAIRTNVLVVSGSTVGIGTTSPTNALDVSGHASFRTNVFLPNLPTNASPVAFLAVDAGGKVFETATPAGGGGLTVSGTNGQIAYINAAGTGLTNGTQGGAGNPNNPGFGFNPTGPNGSYGGLMVFSDVAMGLLTVGHPNSASDFNTPAVGLVVSNRYVAGDFKQELVHFDAVDAQGSASRADSTLLTFRNWAGTTPTIVAEVRKDGLITSAAGFQNSPLPGSASAALILWETNQSKAFTISAPTVLVSNINLTLPAGISNGYMRVTSVNDSNFNVTFETPGTSYTPLLVAGTGSALTNFTFLTTQPEVIINGFTNVSITGVMGYDPARADYWTLTITNGGGTDRPLIFSSQTNRWRFSGTYGTNAPNTLTNMTALHISARSLGTNTRVGYTYFPWP